MKKQVFDLRKVIDPYRHMPKKIKEALFEYARDGQLSNDTYLEWTVDGEDYEDDENYLKVNKWMLKHFDIEEEIIILYSW